MSHKLKNYDCILKNMPKLAKLVIILNILSIFHLKTGIAVLIPNGDLCGTVKTVSGDTVTIRNGVALSLEEFEKVKTDKLKNAVVEPEENCAVNVCGASSWKKGEWEETVDGAYAGCQLISRTTTLNNRYDPFNTSSLSCGCKEDNPHCLSANCEDKASKINWTENQCAALFQERRCSDCYLRPVFLLNAWSYTFERNYSEQFIGLIVRKGCFVEHLWDLDKPVILYDQDTTWDWYTGGFKISYKSDSELFVCHCGVDLNSVVGPNATFAVRNSGTVTTTPPSGFNDRVNTALVVGIVCGATVLILVVGFAAFYIVRFKRLGGGGRDSGGEDDGGFAVVKKEFDEKCSHGCFVARNKFKMGKAVGNGNFGIVYEGKLKQESDGLWEIVAVKVIKWNAPKPVRSSFFRELKTYQRILEGHENIVRFLGACCDEGGLYLLSEFCEGGTLEDELAKLHAQVFERVPPPPPENVVEGLGNYFANNYEAELVWMEQKKPKLTPEELVTLLRWCEQIAAGMEYLHSKGIIQGDLAPRNLLLRNGIIKICDFGLSKDFFAQSLLEGGFPFHSFAPELNNENPTGPKKITAFVDIWAFGCTVYQIFMLGGPLYPSVDAKTLMEVLEAVSSRLSQGYRHRKPDLDPGYAHGVLLECWDEVPDRRPQFTSLRQFFYEKANAEMNGMISLKK